MQRDFKGIWIPKEIWLSEDLTNSEKNILIEIDSLDNEDHCFASNDHFSKFFGIRPEQVSRIISSLIEKKYISLVSFDGRTRILKSNLHCGKTQGSLAEKRKHSNTSLSSTANKERNIYKEIFHENDKAEKEAKTNSETSSRTNLKKEPKEKSCAKKEKVVHDSEWLRNEVRIFFKKYPDKYPYHFGLELIFYFEEGDGNGKIRLQEKCNKYFSIARRLASFWANKSEWQKEKLWDKHNEKLKSEESSERYEQTNLFSEIVKQTTPQY